MQVRKCFRTINESRNQDYLDHKCYRVIFSNLLCLGSLGNKQELHIFIEIVKEGDLSMVCTKMCLDVCSSYKPKMVECTFPAAVEWQLRGASTTTSRNTVIVTFPGQATS